MQVDTKKTAAMFKALCDENRLRILLILKNGERCGCRLLEEMNITQPTLSHHMKILCDGGIVKGRKDGKWTYYSIDESGARAARECLERLTKTEAAAENCCQK